MTHIQRILSAAAACWAIAAGAAAQSPTTPPPAPPPAAAAAPAAAPAIERLRALTPRIEQNLRENVVPFWFPRCVDAVNGGYTVHYGPKGEPLPGGVKMIVTQSRQLWLASALLRSRYAIPGLRDAADHGFRFLRDVMWDKAHGGFYWQVDVTGQQVMRAQKHLYGQAFAVYALSEYAIATGDKEALAFALRAFRLIDAKAHDAVHGGYREYFAADWSAPPAGEASPLGAAPDVKLMNTHLHLMEAFATLLRASADPVVRERLIELVAIETHAVVRVGWTAHTDRHQADWTPILDAAASRVSYGHDLENIWLVADALDALNQPVAPYTDLFRNVFAYSRQHGWDEAKGGFYDSGPKGQPADRRQKVWWVQSEVIVAALEMYRQTRDPAYLEIFEKTWRFIDTAQTDWTNGEWFESIAPDGTPSRGNKATPWKGGYHNGRALLQVLDRLARLQ
jgi:mannose/cellobiose epimerase-like protein (N-acyl-D-glucosamine 2-epimerase family)